MRPQDQKDLHDLFIEELQERIPKKVELVNSVSDMLRIEKESVYRRLAGKVNFTVKEIGIIAKKMNISLDGILHKDEGRPWLPLSLDPPMTSRNMKSLLDEISSTMQRAKAISEGANGVSGRVFGTLPLELFIHSPLLTKFMFFKLGNYFVRSEEFNNFGEWEMPASFSRIIELNNSISDFPQTMYIWDSSLVWLLAMEIKKFYKMHIITAEEKKLIRDELMTMMTRLEQTLNGTYLSNIQWISDMDFYVSSNNLGFTCCYYTSDVGKFALLQTNFSYSMIENINDAVSKIKGWADSLLNISTLISRSGRMDRRLFFESQYEIIEKI